MRLYEFYNKYFYFETNQKLKEKTAKFVDIWRLAFVAYNKHRIEIKPPKYMQTNNQKIESIASQIKWGNKYERKRWYFSQFLYLNFIFSSVSLMDQFKVTLKAPKGLCHRPFILLTINCGRQFMMFQRQRSIKMYSVINTNRHNWYKYI